MDKDPRMAMATDAIRGALANLRVALAVLGEVQAGGEQPPKEQSRPPMFGAARPAASDAANHDS